MLLLLLVSGYEDNSGEQMKKTKLKSIAKLRLLIGYLGEKNQYSWWLSSFFAPTSSSFLNPIFGKTSFIAQYQGVKEAATRVHDEYIGVGEVYHLFRLPENIEISLFQLMHDEKFILETKEILTDKDRAQKVLSELLMSSPRLKEGPVLIGDIDDFLTEESLSDIANLYHSAFLNNVRVAPYCKDKK